MIFWKIWKLMMKKPFYFYAAALCLAPLFFSCSSASKHTIQNPFITLESLGEFEPLAEGGAVYLSIDAQRSRPILDMLSFNGGSAADAAVILNKTTAITAAFYPQDRQDGLAFLLFARGSYPKGLADFSLGLAKDWKKTKSLVAPVPYWYSKTNKTALSFNKKYALVSNSDPFAPTNALTAPGTVPPDGFAGFKQDAVIAGWLNDAGSILNAALEKQGLPFTLDITELFFRVSPVSAPSASEPFYETEIRMGAASEEAAMGLAGLFSIARMFAAQIDETGGLNDKTFFLIHTLFSGTPKQDGAFLTLNLGRCNAEQTALLFNLFSVN
ncbi:MAG: hypothetical protein LBP19_03005 [Treponema sp.]|jgi:hypothetical protein|nr:hypothetical protein [Treponema sp.]